MQSSVVALILTETQKCQFGLKENCDIIVLSAGGLHDAVGPVATYEFTSEGSVRSHGGQRRGPLRPRGNSNSLLLQHYCCTKLTRVVGLPRPCLDRRKGRPCVWSGRRRTVFLKPIRM